MTHLPNTPAAALANVEPVNPPAKSYARALGRLLVVRPVMMVAGYVRRMVTGGRTTDDWLTTLLLSVPVLSVAITTIPVVAMLMAVVYTVVVVSVCGWISYHGARFFYRALQKEAKRISNE